MFSHDEKEVGHKLIKYCQVRLQRLSIASRLSRAKIKCSVFCSEVQGLFFACGEDFRFFCENRLLYSASLGFSESLEGLVEFFGAETTYLLSFFVLASC